MSWRKQIREPSRLPRQLQLFEEVSLAGCNRCLCRDCLLWWSSRCPYGGCYDDYRAKVRPYDAEHLNDPPRTSWTEWKTEQAFWCRGGTCYPQAVCEHYTHYEGSTVKSCILANVQIFQDGYLFCSCVDNVGCEECYRRLEAQEKAKETDK